MSPVSTNTAYIRCNILRLKWTLQVLVVTVHTSCVHVTNLWIFLHSAIFMLYILLFFETILFVLAIKRPCVFYDVGTGVLDAICVPFKRLFISCSFFPPCVVVGEGIWMKFGVRAHTEDLSTNVHTDLHRTVCDNHVFCFVHDGCSSLSICENEKMFRTEIVHIFCVFDILNVPDN